MALHIIVDGYNVIGTKGGGRLSPWEDLERQRERLLEQLRLFKTRRNLRVTVVFDGPEGGVKETMRWGLRVLFAGGDGKADSVIEGLARNMSGAVVVTSDLALAQRCRKAGATVMGAEELLERMKEPDPQDDFLEEDEEPRRKCFTRKKGPRRKPPKKDRRDRHKLQRL